MLLGVKTRGMNDILPGREVIFEFHSIGAIVRVSAMDTASMTEVVTQGPVSAGEATLKRNALRRLAYVLRKKGVIA